ncbi:MAG TPA: tetratricopeptide repeat protein [Candidatus Methanoperedens sp.]|nr:tetratricopeptide repeat protein [Candidatus Methanoperedens sp.]
MVFLRRDRWYPLVPLLAAILAYSGSLGHQFVMEDQSLVNYVKTILTERGFLSLLSADFRLSSDGGSMGYYRPVVLMSLWLDSQIAAVFPHVFHLTNVILHGAVTWVLYFVIREMIGSPFGASAGAFLFAVHPVHVESVAFVSGRTDLWATLFVLAHTYLWLQARRGTSVQPWPRRAVAVGCYVLGSLSKETALLLPLLLILLDGLGASHSERRPREWWRRNGGWLVLWGAGLTVTVLLRFLVARVGFGGGQGPGMQAALSQGWSMLLAKVAFYLKLLVLPWPLNPFWEADRIGWGWAVVASSLLFLVLCLSGGGKRQRHVGIFALGWTVAFLLPVLGFVPIQGAVVAERYLYLPSVGLALAVGALMAREPSLLYAVQELGDSRECPSLPEVRSASREGKSFRRCRADRQAANVLRASGPRYASRRFLAVYLALAGVFLLGTMTRVRAWADELTLFSTMVESFPESPFGWYFLAGANTRLGRHQEAVAAAKTAVRLKPDFDLAYFSLGNSFEKLGLPEESAVNYRELIRLRPDFRVAYLALGTLYARRGELRETMEVYRQAIRAIPGFSQAYYFLGICYGDQGLYREAIAAFQEAIRLKHDDPAFHLGLGAAQSGAGLLSEAIGSLENAVRLFPDLEEGHMALGDLYLEVGNPGRAVGRYLEALRIQNNNLHAARGLGQAYVSAGKIPEAVAVLEEVLRRWPNDSESAALLSRIDKRQKEQP